MYMAKISFGRFLAGTMAQRAPLQSPLAPPNGGGAELCLVYLFSPTYSTCICTTIFKICIKCVVMLCIHFWFVTRQRIFYLFFNWNFMFCQLGLWSHLRENKLNLFIMWPFLKRISPIWSLLSIRMCIISHFLKGMATLCFFRIWWFHISTCMIRTF